MRLDQLLSDDVDVSPDMAGAEIDGLTADSRDVKPGYLFAALPGVNVDGAKFIPKALENGAVAVLTSQAGGDGRLVHAENPRQVLARAAARFYNQQPESIVAVTGTNGKTSVVSFVRQLWRSQGVMAASVGTVGVEVPCDVEPVDDIGHTTPDPVTLQRVLDQLGQRKISHAAIEASSHGLSQYRLDGVRLAGGAFTNISRDHLDYHESFDDYFAQKMRLFGELLPPGAPAVIDADSAEAGEVIRIARARGLNVVTVGSKGETLKLLSAEPVGYAQSLRIAAEGEEFDIYLPLAGSFQVSNALVAAGLVMASGNISAGSLLPALENLTGARGRLELVGHAAAGAPVFVDYSHTPDALETALKALRPYASGKLRVVIGAGGDRDPGKREMMGRAAADHADVAYVTDDNPRTEDPAAIRAAVQKGCPYAANIAGRAEAIRTAIRDTGEGDLVLVAGKGHEPYQEIGTERLPFSDHDEILAALEGQRQHD
ncbi:MAG: UDP-N-acetylmuramoyl-L-alanyl-D-glutamate--2,6-diaminopimelate ligase [Pseudomonadota bacterium]